MAALLAVLLSAELATRSAPSTLPTKLTVALIEQVSNATLVSLTLVHSRDGPVYAINSINPLALSSIPLAGDCYASLTSVGVNGVAQRAIPKATSSRVTRLTRQLQYAEAPASLLQAAEPGVWACLLGLMILLTLVHLSLYRQDNLVAVVTSKDDGQMYVVIVINE